MQYIWLGKSLFLQLVILLFNFYVGKIDYDNIFKAQLYESRSFNIIITIATIMIVRIYFNYIPQVPQNNSINDQRKSSSFTFRDPYMGVFWRVRFNYQTATQKLL